MAKQSSWFLFLIIMFLLYSCSSEKTQKQDDASKELDELIIQDLKLDVNEIYSWVNLMPGSDPRFHITGDFDLLESIKYDFKFVKLVSVIIYHDNTEVYRISPVVQEGDSDDQSRNIKFSTIRGLLLSKDLNTDQIINIDLVFSEGSRELVYKLDNIKINKVY